MRLPSWTLAIAALIAVAALLSVPLGPADALPSASRVALPSLSLERRTSAGARAVRRRAGRRSRVAAAVFAVTLRPPAVVVGRGISTVRPGAVGNSGRLAVALVSEAALFGITTLFRVAGLVAVPRVLVGLLRVGALGIGGVAVRLLPIGTVTVVVWTLSCIGRRRLVVSLPLSGGRPWAGALFTRPTGGSGWTVTATRISLPSSCDRACVIRLRSLVSRASLANSFGAARSAVPSTSASGRTIGSQAR